MSTLSTNARIRRGSGSRNDCTEGTASRERGELASLGPDEAAPRSDRFLLGAEARGNEDAKAALLNMATEIQRVVEGNDAPEILRQEIMRASICSNRTAREHLSHVQRRIEPLVLDTPAKIRAYAAWNQKQSGRMYQLPVVTVAEACAS